jgi:uncharacterized RDD family membrane protein YckC
VTPIRVLTQLVPDGGIGPRAMDTDHLANPYAPPTSDLDAGPRPGMDTAELAEPGARLAAVSIDGFLVSIPCLPGFIVAMYYLLARSGVMLENGLQDSADGHGMVVAGVLMGMGGLVTLGIMVYQWVLISKTGQSLGKKWMGIRIVRVDGKPMSFGSGVVLRNWIPKLLGAMPYAGLVFHLVDSFFVFRADRRCLHDEIAGTRVIRHNRAEP